MFARYFVLLMFIISLIFPHGAQLFATSEVIFDNPTFGDISGTASQAGGLNNSDPIAGNSADSPNQYCIEQGLFLAYYTVGEPSPFGTKAAFNTGSDIWETAGPTTKLASQIICSTLPIVGTSHIIAGTFSNNYWDNSFPGTASGQVTNVLVTARVLPSLNMSISTGTIDLGNLAAGVASVGSLFLEIGTNAKSGVSITARSQSGGLTNTDDPTIQINDLTADGIAESYTWASTPNVTDDSSSAAFVATGLTALEINDDTTEHIVYSTTTAEATNLVDDVEFTVSTTIGAETPAGEYEDYITFTVTGNF